MTNSQIFKKAHEITKEFISNMNRNAVKPNYSVTFSAALKIVIATEKRTLLVREGKKITGPFAAMELFISKNKTNTYFNVDVIELSNPNKRELAEIDALIAAINTPVKTPVKTSTTGRYVELLATAERLGLNHGKSWVCSGFQVDRYSIDPSFEGELVCYVYPVAA